MSNLMCCKSIDLNSLRATESARRSFADSPRLLDPQEPIHVRVRIRRHGDFAWSFPQIRSDRPDPARQPVGTHLDCYV